MVEEENGLTIGFGLSEVGSQAKSPAKMRSEKALSFIIPAFSVLIYRSKDTRLAALAFMSDLT